MLATTLNALPNDFIRMMRNWVKVKADPNLVVYAASSAYDGISASSGYAEARIPYLRIEFDDVDGSMEAVALKYRTAVSLFWVNEGYGFRWLGNRMRVDHKTAKEWVDKGHRLVRAELTRRLDARARSAAQLATVQASNGSRGFTGSIHTVVRLDHISVDTTKIPQ